MKKLLFIFLCLLICGVLHAEIITNNHLTQKHCFIRASILEQEQIRATNERLTLAVLHNDIKQIETLIKKGVDVNAPSSRHNKLPLFCEILLHSNNNDIIKLLVDNGANVNMKCHNDFTPLHKLLINDRNLNDRNLDIIKYVIAKGADVNAQDEQGKTPLFYTVFYIPTKETTKYLIDNGANVNVQDNKGNTPLFYAKTKETAKYLVDNGADVNILNKKGDNCLTYKSFSSNNLKEEFKLFAYLFPLLKNVDKNKLLHQAVEGGNLKIVKMLVKNGADVNSIDDKNRTVLAKTMNKEIAKYLVSKGAKINNVYQAIAADKTKLAKEFINKENYSDEQIEKIFYYAAYFGNIEIAKLLIDKGIDVNIKSKCQNNCNCETTPLHIAIGGGNLKIVKFLVNNGADINAKASGIAPLASAAKANRTKIMKYFIKQGADVNNSFYNDKSIFYYPCERCHKEAIEILLKNKAEIDTNKQSEFIQNLIFYPSEKSCPLKKKEQILKMMIKYGLNINIEIDSFGDNILDRVIHYDHGNTEVEKMLIKLGAKGYPSLREYAYNGNKEMILFLLKYGFDINTKNKHGNTILEEGDYITEDMMQFLISHGAKSDCALFNYAYYDDIETIKLLLKNGVDINVQDGYGQTALDYAHTDEMKQFLISHGAKSGKELKEKSN